MDNIIKQRLKQLRVENGLTQEEFGKPYNLRKSTISQYESGDSRPDDELKIRIALDYGVSLDWLFGLTNKRKGDNIEDKLSKEAIDEINNFIEYVKYKYRNEVK